VSIVKKRYHPIPSTKIYQNEEISVLFSLIKYFNWVEIEKKTRRMGKSRGKIKNLFLSLPNISFAFNSLSYLTRAKLNWVSMLTKSNYNCKKDLYSELNLHNMGTDCWQGKWKVKLFSNFVLAFVWKASKEILHLWFDGKSHKCIEKFLVSIYMNLIDWKNRFFII